MDTAAGVAINPAYTGHDESFRSRHVYFYYLRDHDSPRPHKDVYKFETSTELAPGEVEDEMRRFVRKIRGPNPPPVLGHGFEDLPWEHRSYFAAVFEGALTPLAAFTFHYKPRFRCGPNHSFFGGVDIPKVESGLSGFFCANHMLDLDGTPLRAKSQSFLVQANHSGNPNPPPPPWWVCVSPVRAHLDSGTNTGPP